MTVSKFILSFSAALMMALSGSAFSADEAKPEATTKAAEGSSKGAELYVSKGCVACHGADGKTTTMPTYPNIAGQNKEYIEQQMKDIKSGDRANGQSIVMKGIMSAISAEELTEISAYVAGLE